MIRLGLGDVFQERPIKFLHKVPKAWTSALRLSEVSRCRKFLAEKARSVSRPETLTAY